jgi:hypothetical protein
MERAVWAMLPVLLANAGCTAVLAPGERQCETAKDCEDRGFSGAVCAAGVCEEKAVEVDPVWGCLGNVVEPEPDPTKRVDLSVKLQYVGEMTPVTEATIDVCAKLDLACTGMNPDYPKGLSPDANGDVELSLVQGFDGFVRITGPDLMDSRIFVGRPIVKPPAPKAVWLLRPSDYDLLIAYTKQTRDMTRGTAIVFGVDCQGVGASGLRFENSSADTKSLEFYLVNQFPTAPPAAEATDVDGYGGFFNLPVGPSITQSFRDEDGEFVGESSFQVLAETISYVQVAPTPM